MAELFSGHSEHTLDAKGRVIVPTRFRSHFVDGAYLGKGNDHRLELWTRDNYNKKAASWLEKLESGDEELEAKALFWSAYIEDVTVDANTGRLLIPPYMRDWAQLEPGQPVMLQGALNHIAVWNPTVFADRVGAKAEPGFARD